MLEQVKQLASAFHTECIAIRRHLHQNPELSFEEKKTAAYISSKLTDYGIEHQQNVAGYGIVALIKGKSPAKRCIALRADIDALPIQEESDQPYRSLNNGVMHACGHDAHTAILLGAAYILSKITAQFVGCVKLIFQPAEEQLPGGAIGMIEAGVLSNPQVDAIVALHVLPTLSCGTLGFRSGPFMASGDEVNIVVSGKGGHAAMPDLITDTILTASQIVVNLQQLVSRMAAPTIPTVLSFGRIIGNGAHNIIPNEVLIQGTFRTFDENWRNRAKEHIQRIAIQTAAQANAIAKVNIVNGYPVLINNPQITTQVQAASEIYVGKHMLTELDQRMTTEDFAYYSQHIPACFFRLGTANENISKVSGLHTSTFDIDEDSLKTGSGLMAWIAVQLLEK